MGFNCFIPYFDVTCKFRGYSFIGIVSSRPENWPKAYNDIKNSNFLY